MNVRHPIYRALALALLVTGCAASPTTRFYLLSPLPAAPVAAGPERMPTLGVGPLELPRYLDRPQIITRGSGQEVVLGEYDRWAEPLKDGLQRVLGENLARLLPHAPVQSYPWRRSGAPEYQVQVQIIRFDREVDGDAVLEARWGIVDREGEVRLPARTRSYRAPPSDTGYAQTVAALNTTLADLSREIAEAVRGLDVAGIGGVD